MGIWSRILLLLKVRAKAAMERAEDPREVFDYAYSEHRELLRNVQACLIEVSASKVQLEQRVRQLEERVPQMENHARRALDVGRENLARLALQRKHAVIGELRSLSRQVTELDAEEQRMVSTQMQLAAQIEAFRHRHLAIGADYSAAEAQVAVREALTGISGRLDELGMAVDRAEHKTERLEIRAKALGALLESGAIPRPFGGPDELERAFLDLDTGDSVEHELQELRKTRIPPELPERAQSG